MGNFYFDKVSYQLIRKSNTKYNENFVDISKMSVDETITVLQKVDNICDIREIATSKRNALLEVCINTGHHFSENFGDIEELLDEIDERIKELSHNVIERVKSKMIEITLENTRDVFKNSDYGIDKVNKIYNSIFLKMKDEKSYNDLLFRVTNMNKINCYIEGYKAEISISDVSYDEKDLLIGVLIGDTIIRGKQVEIHLDMKILNDGSII